MGYAGANTHVLILPMPLLPRIARTPSTALSDNARGADDKVIPMHESKSDWHGPWMMLAADKPHAKRWHGQGGTLLDCLFAGDLDSASS
jgi:hypothetical protein